MTARATIFVRGRVQGVGFRYHCAYTAQELGVVGQVRNLPDGDVEVMAQGEPEAVGRLIAWLRRGPRWASVRRLTVTGSTLRARPVAFKTAIAQALRQQVWPWIESGRVRPVIDRVFPAQQAAQAHAHLEAGGHVGKVMLAW